MKINLIHSFPWDATYLKESNFNYFSIRGYYTRQFYISIAFDGCNGDVGILMVNAGIGSCAYSNAWYNGTAFTFPQIIYVNNKD